MLSIELDKEAGIAILTPEGELSGNDFKAVAEIVDPFIEEHGDLKGIAIHVENFPGWDSFSSLVSHLKFVKDHHRRVSRIAFATNSPVGTIAEKVGNHFVSAEIKHFDFNELDAAKIWISGDSL
ncbi:MAG: STAS/SEC14 domain-containing protein [Halioglobus sp.]